MDIFSNEMVGLIFSLYAAAAFACLITLLLFVGCGPVQSQVQGTSYSPLPPQPPGAYAHQEGVPSVSVEDVTGADIMTPIQRPVSHPWERVDISASSFVTVPATMLPGGHIEPSFKVGRYLCSRGADGAVVIDSALPPWVCISYEATLEACAAGGVSLISERQALALAINIASVAANWTGGGVGQGSLFRGLHKHMSRVQPGGFDPVGTGEQRWFTLSNGERICDAAGNAYTWVFDNVHGDERGLVARAISSGSLSVACAPFPPQDHGVGWYPAEGADWVGYALVRGGRLGSDNTGIFNLNRQLPGYAFEHLGFRCTK